MSVQSDGTDRDPEWTPGDKMDYEDELNESETNTTESNDATERKSIVFEPMIFKENVFSAGVTDKYRRRR